MNRTKHRRRSSQMRNALASLTLLSLFFQQLGKIAVSTSRTAGVLLAVDFNLK